VETFRRRYLESFQCRLTPYLGEWLERYLNVDKMRGEKWEIISELGTDIAKMQKEGRLDTKDPELNETIEKLGIEGFLELEHSTNDEATLSVADKVIAENKGNSETQDLAGMFEMAIAAENASMEKPYSPHASTSNDSFAADKNAHSEFSIATNPELKTEEIDIAIKAPKGFNPITGQG
jgi:hypothetical protein